MAFRTRVLPMVVATIAFTAGGDALSAHDMWIEPTTFMPRGEVVGLRLRVGQDLIGDPLPHDSALIQDFLVEDADGRRPVVGRPGTDPAGLVRLAPSGGAVVIYPSRPSRVEMSAEKFDRYLKEEGLDAVAGVRARAGTNEPVREMFSRCAKSLLSAGGRVSADGTTPVGMTLELTAEQSPYALTTGADLPVRLLYRGQPLHGALVVALNQARPDEKLSARSDREGRVRFRLTRAGMWLVKAVHAVPAAGGSGADWESFWASLTFALPDGGRHETR